MYTGHIAIAKKAYMLRNIHGISIDTAKVWLIYGITHHNKVIVNYQFEMFYLVIFFKNRAFLLIKMRENLVSARRILTNICPWTSEG